MEFSKLKRRKVIADFTGGEITSDAGCLLIREIDNKLKITESIAPVIKDKRDASKVQHPILSLIRQRIYAMIQGYEDLNDQQTLRHDTAMQTAVSVDSCLSSSSTLCRFENSIDREDLVNMSKQIVELFIASFKRPPKELILDFDATDDTLYGDQEGSYYHGYYKSHCYLPLHVYCGKELLVNYLRTSNLDPAKHTLAILKLLVVRIRKAFPKVKIIFRADSGFCRDKIMRWCEKYGVQYITGMSSNNRVKAYGKTWLSQAAQAFEATKEKQRLFHEFTYAAKTWKHLGRRVILKAEHTSKGSNPRHIITNIAGDPQELYDKLYCARGDMENRIKESQLDLFSDRTSCSAFLANQYRLLVSAISYVLINEIRKTALAGTKLAGATCGTIRLKLFKIGAVITKNTRKIKLHLSSSYPDQDLFKYAVARLCAG
jgi:hypothetical protein